MNGVNAEYAEAAFFRGSALVLIAGLCSFPFSIQIWERSRRLNRPT
jgi:hypothetical protein